MAERHGLSPERADYELTEEEWLALGGNEPPTYDEMMENLERGWSAGKGFGGLGVLRNGPQGLPAIDYGCAQTWQEVADRVGCHLLTIHWPDHHFPDFTAVPR